MTDESKGALDGLFVLDLSRILAGPTATQLFGDLGATVVKIENPKTGGDDTRAWGPPFAKDANGQDTDLSAYFMAANRNKYSVAADLTTPGGRDLVRSLVARADVLIENYKPGGLKKYGLDYDSLAPKHPGLVYCSISGFGQTGPNRHKAGYDLMAQGYGGIMSLTGPAEGAPHKVGIGIADVMCGMYAAVGILAALRHRDRTGEGQHIDLALVDATMAWLINEGTNYLTSGRDPVRRGNAHPNIAPYEVFESRDGHVILAVGNDGQFQRFCAAMDLPDLACDPRFATNPLRLSHRDALRPLIAARLAAQTTAEITARLDAATVPVGPIHTVGQALGSEQAREREMVVDLPAPTTARGTLPLLGNPLKFSRTPIQYRKAPPHFGADTETWRSDFEKDRGQSR